MKDKDDLERDRAWMRGYLLDEVGSFQAIYSTYSGRVYSYLQRRLRNPDDLEEVFQKIWMKFHQSREGWSSEYPVLQWLFVISRSVLTDHFRFEARRGQGLISIESNSGKEAMNTVAAPLSADNFLADEQAERFRLEESFEKQGLSREQIEVVRMRVFEEEDYEEIAKRLGKSSVSIRKTFSRALERLRSFKL